MRAAKRDLLEIYAMRSAEGKKVKIYLGMYYNPYYPEEYQRWTCLKFFDKGNDFLIGKDFWDFLGGIGAYEELIDIYEKVGEGNKTSARSKVQGYRKGSKIIKSFGLREFTPLIPLCPSPKTEKEI